MPSLNLARVCLDRATVRFLASPLYACLSSPQTSVDPSTNVNTVVRLGRLLPLSIFPVLELICLDKAQL